MTAVRMWKDSGERRSWAEVGDLARGHLLAQLLHGNLDDLDSVAQVQAAVERSLGEPALAIDLGFFDSVALSLHDGHALIEHVIEAYGTFDLDARDLRRVLEVWSGVVGGQEGVDTTVALEWPTRST